MRKRSLLGSTLALVALSVSIAGVTADAADAKPREVNCLAIGDRIDQAYDLSQAAYAQGDQAGGDSWNELYLAAQENYDRYCLS